MDKVEQQLRLEAQGFTLICGVDEAGRGPLCGPVVAAACILAPGETIEGLNDSKKLTARKREKLFDQIKQRALTYCIAQATVREIDSINILEASLLAMRRAIDGLYPIPQAALIDGNVDRDFALPAAAVVGGDALVESISAASILAKVTRDRMCIDLDAQYPVYGIAKHKGYGTAVHMAALREHGAAPIHRARFVRFLTPGAPVEDTDADPQAIAQAKSPAAWEFPKDCKPSSPAEAGERIPSSVLDYKHTL